ncbi:MAG TPA: LpqB family beta-propeller domain-containing protein, partial [Candidatus Eisenbacteria bacterium]|nr:LpqB family beta-propeller domain-containing protein [Candidatus Eisenbacteria bacterium]
MQIQRSFCVAAVLLGSVLSLISQSKPKLTLDDFFNSVSFSNIELSPDGNSVVFATERPNWDQQIFRTDLWLYRDDGKSLIQLTQSGHDSDPKWSPDGKWIAFLSERKNPAGKADDSDSDKDKDDEVSQIYLISPGGGEAFAITQGEEDVHAFSWSANSQTIYYSTRQPWTKQQKDDYKQQWKDVVQYRTAERGDAIFALNLAEALAHHASEPARVEKKEGEPEKQPDVTPGAKAIATISLRIDDLQMSPDGAKLAFVTNAINQRQEKYEDVEIYVFDLTNAGVSGTLVQPQRITHNQGEEVRPRWANDSRHIFFFIGIGDVSGPYRDLQPHLYWVNVDDGKIEQWDKSFMGPVEHYSVMANSVMAAARLGTEVQMYDASKPSDKLHRLTNKPGTYAQFSATPHSTKVAFVYSSLGSPAEIYLAEAADKFDQARPITSFNKKLAETDLPQGKPYQWKSDDGTTVQGMLIYPPG